MKVLITGANGFVGGHVSRYLMARGIECVALDVKGVPEQGVYSARTTWDDLDTLDLSTFDGVIHLAGKAHDTKNASDPQSYFDINVGLTKRVLGAVLKCESAKVLKLGEERSSSWQSQLAVEESGAVLKCEPASLGATPRQVSALVGETKDQGHITNERMNYRTNALKFIFFSSVKACADTVEGVLTEECVPNPQTPYGKSKLEAEREVLKFEPASLRATPSQGSAKVLKLKEEVLTTRNAENTKNIHLRQGYGGQVEHSIEESEVQNFRTLELQNFRTFILRPAMIQGPGNKGNMELLIKVVQKGIPWPLGAFENKRSFASIENVSRVVEALLIQDVEPGIYQVADDEPLSTNQLIERIAESLGRKPRIWKLPRGLMRGVARVGDLLHLPLNSERLKKLTESYVVSNAKLRKAFCDHTVVAKK
jgi:nucleoside-diphosphate-sugar epimerase